MMANHELPDEFRRTRRSLLLVSFLICAVKHTGIDIEKLKFFDVEVLLKPTEVYAVMWISWTYFFYYYGQIFLKNELWDRTIKVINNFREYKIIKIISSAGLSVPNVGDDLHYYKMVKKNDWTYTGHKRKYDNNQENGNKCTVSISRWKISYSTISPIF